MAQQGCFSFLWVKPGPGREEVCGGRLRRRKTERARLGCQALHGRSLIQE